MNVTLKSNSGLTLTVLLWNTTPLLSDGVTNYDTVSRPKRQAITRYNGRNPFQQTIAVMFDGWSSDESQEGRIKKLETMGAQPHSITLSGHALRKDLDWLITGLVWDNQETLWKNLNGSLVRVRQACTITLLEQVEGKVLKTPAAPKTDPQNKQPVKKITVAKGMTVKAIAQVEFGDPDQWRKIVNDNVILLGAGPRTVVPAGTILTVTGGRVPIYTVP